VPDHQTERCGPAFARRKRAFAIKGVEAVIFTSIAGRSRSPAQRAPPREHGAARGVAAPIAACGGGGNRHRCVQSREAGSLLQQTISLLHGALSNCPSRVHSRLEAMVEEAAALEPAVKIIAGVSQTISM
jgi:hypothetical protein